MKLPRFLRIDPDFRRAVDFYPDKRRITFSSYANDIIFRGGPQNEIVGIYREPTWAERRYVRSARLNDRNKRARERKAKDSIEKHNKKVLDRLLGRV